MIAMKRGWMLVSVLLALLSGCAECAVAQTPLAVTTVQDTVYTASGAAASGTVSVSWSGFTTASGAVVPAGTTSVTIGTSGLLSMTLAPNAGATPIGSYYTAIFHLSDGSTSRQYWVVPVAVAGGSPVRLAAIQNQVLPTSVAMQTVSKAYVDTAIAAAMAGHPLDSSAPFVSKAGDTMTGTLVLPTIDVGTLNATTIAGAVDGASIASGTVNAARLPVFGPSGSTHAAGVAPDPGATAGVTRYLREDGTWDVPAGGSGGATGTMAAQNANAVAITGGTISGATADGTNIGQTTPALGTFTLANTLKATVATPTSAATTILTFSGPSYAASNAYIVSCSDSGNNTATYFTASALVEITSPDGSGSRLVNFTNAVDLSLSLSGLNLQASSGNGGTVTCSALRFL